MITNLWLLYTGLHKYLVCQWTMQRSVDVVVVRPWSRAKGEKREERENWEKNKKKKKRLAGMGALMQSKLWSVSLRKRKKNDIEGTFGFSNSRGTRCGKGCQDFTVNWDLIKALSFHRNCLRLCNPSCTLSHVFHAYFASCFYLCKSRSDISI